VETVDLALAAVPERSEVHAQRASRGEESSGGRARTASHLARSWSPRGISTSLTASHRASPDPLEGVRSGPQPAVRSPVASLVAARGSLADVARMALP
jgi:hypothetical protein